MTILNLIKLIEEWKDGQTPFDFTPDYLTLHKMIDAFVGLLERYQGELQERQTIDEVQKWLKAHFGYYNEEERTCAIRPLQHYIKKEILGIE